MMKLAVLLDSYVQGMTKYSPCSKLWNSISSLDSLKSLTFRGSSSWKNEDESRPLGACKDYNISFYACMYVCRLYVFPWLFLLYKNNTEIILCLPLMAPVKNEGWGYQIRYFAFYIISTHNKNVIQWLCSYLYSQIMNGRANMNTPLTL